MRALDRKVHIRRTAGIVIIAVFAAILLLLSAQAQSFADTSDWTSFQNGGANNGIAGSSTAISGADAKMRWGVKISEDNVTPAIVVDGKVYVAAGKYVYEIDRITGGVLKKSSSPMAASCEHALFPMTYGDGKLFVPVFGGRVQAVSKDTLDPLWVTESTGGQSLSPITYKEIGGKGWIFTGSYSNDGSYYAATVDDSDIKSGVKNLKWRFTPSADDPDLSRAGNGGIGFYWAGAYTDGNHLFFGSDASGSTGVSTFYSLDVETGGITDKITGVTGSVRSTPVFYRGHLYFVSQGGKLYKAAIESSGSFGAVSSLDLGGEMTTTPVIHDDRLYVGVKSSDSAGTNHYSVVDVAGELAPASEIYREETPAYCQGSPVLSTSSGADGEVRVYLTYNAYPGGLYYFTDKPGKTASSGLKTLFEPGESGMKQFCISQLAVDDEGTIFYRNDSNYMMAIENRGAYIEDLSVSQDAGGEVVWKGDSFSKTKFKYSLLVSDDAKTLTFDDLAGSLTYGATHQMTVDGESAGTGNVAALNESGSTEITIRVTNGSIVRFYDFTVTREGDDSSLSILKLSETGSLTQNNDNILTAELSEGLFDYATGLLPQDERPYYLFVKATSPGSEITVKGVSNVDPETMYNGELDGSYHKLDGSLMYTILPADIKKDVKVSIDVVSSSGASSSKYNVTLSKAGDDDPGDGGDGCGDSDKTDDKSRDGANGNDDTDARTPSDASLKNAKVDKSISVDISGVTTTAKMKKKAMTAKWEKTRGAVNYLFSYREAKAGKWTEKWTSGKNSFVIKRMKKNGLCEFRIMAVKKTGSGWVKSGWSKSCYRFFANTKQKIKAGKGSVNVTVKKVGKGSGYEVLYIEKKSVGKTKVRSLKGAKKTRLKIKGLKSKKRYCIQSRPFKTYKGKKYIGILNKAKKVRIK